MKPWLPTRTVQASVVTAIYCWIKLVHPQSIPLKRCIYCTRRTDMKTCQRPFYSGTCINHLEKMLFSQVLAPRRKGVVYVTLLPYDKGFFAFFIIKYVRNSYFFFPRFLGTKTDILLAVRPTNSCKSLSCKDRAMKHVSSKCYCWFCSELD